MTPSSADRARNSQPSRFFDPDQPDRPPTVVLHQFLENRREWFRMGRRIGYLDAHEGTIVVPTDLQLFRSDLTSVPILFTWLVPRSGEHLAAALIHDGLLSQDPGKPHYIADHIIDRPTADRVFRDAMRDLDVPLARRWLMWTAVTLGDLWSSRDPRKYALPFATLLLIAALGTLATIDLFTDKNYIPWIADRSLWPALAAGALMAVVIPTTLSIFWLPRWQAGIISGVALALLLHVTVALFVVLQIYLGFEELLERRIRNALVKWISAAGVSAIVVLLIYWATS